VIGQRCTWNECLAGDAFGEYKSYMQDIPALSGTEWFMSKLSNSPFT